ncbi:hypothetical protein GMRT_10812 [Giardia muris]|uniref:E2F/DP family winged-helix DNA-binding domain-containing protein n=1 Tax=Giardia muris TaxID=5742 RepID=A0A4Z1T4Q9_GIAMU|nr:hypothetical protein GMRT_10812 [Giardia muris]|eukprot:TNJ27509.1 hypothetical protein GMRT_10812 [Giardia muris]
MPEVQAPALKRVAHGERGDKQSTTRSIEMARRLILELSRSAARTREGYVCIAKDDLLSITNKRRLYDVTGPLEAMGVIQTTRLFIVWMGPRLDSFTFVDPTSLNASFAGKNAHQLSLYGKRLVECQGSGDPSGSRPTSNLSRVYTVSDIRLPRYPSAKTEARHRVQLSSLRERLKALQQQKAELEERVRQQEQQFRQAHTRYLAVSDVVRAFQAFFTQNEPRLSNSHRYDQPYATAYGTTPHLFLLYGPRITMDALEPCRDEQYQSSNQSTSIPLSLDPSVSSITALSTPGMTSPAEVRVGGIGQNLVGETEQPLLTPSQLHPVTLLFSSDEPIQYMHSTGCTGALQEYEEPSYPASVDFSLEPYLSDASLDVFTDGSVFTNPMSIGGSYLDTYSDFDYFDSLMGV